MLVDVPRVRLIVGLLVSFPAVGLAAGQSTRSAAVHTSEAGALPTPVRLAIIHEAAQSEGWQSQREMLRAHAREAFATDKLTAASAWLRVYRWAELLGRTEAEVVPAWIDAVNRTGVGHSGMATQYRIEPQQLSLSVTPALQAWLIGHIDFAEEFFSLIQPVDYLPGVLSILSDLHRHDAKRFEAYASLALAIAVVYDVPPPPDWPHGQVTPKILPRKWPDPKETFDWLAKQDELGRTQHSLRRLRADELKFVIDLATPFEELEWAQAAVSLPLNRLESAYSMVRYRKERLASDDWNWSEQDYALETILTKGGICVDQAYFASAVGKSRGVPTLFFQGVGDNGRHAWFGFLGAAQQWHFNAGRYAEQRYVTGFARDPQTWRLSSDHDLKLLIDRSRSSTHYRQSLVLTEFASEFLKDGEAASAYGAARKAVNYNLRNRPAWEILLAAEAALGVGYQQREASLREAMRAFVHYPDLEVLYSKRISESLRNRGETSAADFEQRRIE
ncbi:MAG TPA: hypothetical protein VL069_11745, partial [Opitutus sp.]|nr:hypothetical protein [Opitutus sp.]